VTSGEIPALSPGPATKNSGVMKAGGSKNPRGEDQESNAGSCSAEPGNGGRSHEGDRGKK